MNQPHPYMKEYMEAPLQLHKLKLECLHKRIALMPEGKTDYERNEVTLDKLKTFGEIKALTNIVAEREAYYIQYFNNEFLPAVEDMDKNYASVIATARKRTEQEIIDTLAKVEFQVTGSTNIEGKLLHFKMLKNLLK